MKVSFVEKEGLTWFNISQVDPKYRESVKHLYYVENEGFFAKSFPSTSAFLEKCRVNFQGHIEEIILQMANVTPVPWEKTLLALLKILEADSIDWWLSGSTALAVRGVDVSPHDIDVITDEKGAFELAGLLQDFLFEPIIRTEGWICKVFGKAFLYSVIDVAGAVDRVVDEPEPSDFGPTAAGQLETILWHGHRVRVPPLHLQLSVCERRGRMETAEKIRSADARINSSFLAKPDVKARYCYYCEHLSI